MTVRQSLLAILAVGPCYGYQLRSEFDRRTGSIRPLNVGQIYTTLERLERDGLVRRGATDTEGHLYWEITVDGRAAVTDWFAAPVQSAGGGRDELATKVAIASTLPGVDVSSIVSVQRAAAAARLEDLTRSTFNGEGGDAEELAWALLRDGRMIDAESEMRWLDRCTELLTAARVTPIPLSTAKPRRGRPSKASARR